MTIKAIVHEAEEGGYWAEVPSLPGCYTQGDTLDEIARNLWEAIEGWTESRRDFDPNAEIITSESHELELLITSEVAA